MTTIVVNLYYQKLSESSQSLWVPSEDESNSSQISSPKSSSDSSQSSWIASQDDSDILNDDMDYDSSDNSAMNEINGDNDNNEFGFKFYYIDG